MVIYMICPWDFSGFTRVFNPHLMRFNHFWVWTDSWLHGAGGFDPAACLLFPERICFNCQLHGTFTMVHWHISKYIYIYINGITSFRYTYIYIYTCTCKINPNSCSHGTSGILQPCKHTMQLCMVLPHLLWKAKYSISNYVLIPGSNRA